MEGDGKITITKKNTGERVFTINKTNDQPNVDLEKGKCFKLGLDGTEIYQFTTLDINNEFVTELSIYDMFITGRLWNSTGWGGSRWGANEMIDRLFPEGGNFLNDVYLTPCPGVAAGGRRKRLRTHKTKSSAKSQKRSKKSSTRGR